MTRKNGKTQIIITAVLAAVILIFANYLASRFHFRWDLTEEKEYTLSDATEKIVRNLDDRVLIKLYFTEKIPSNLLPLHQRIMDTLDEYRVASRSKIAVQRIVPESSPEKEMEAQQLGIPPLQLNVVEKDKQEVRKVYLGMALFYGDKKEVLPLVADLRNLEYDLTSAILKLTSPKMPTVGLILPQVQEGQQDNFEVLQKVFERQTKLERLEPDPERLFPDGLDALFIIAPRDLDPALEKNLDEFLEKGVPVVVVGGLTDMQDQLNMVPVRTGLEAWLGRKGVGLSKELLFDPRFTGRAAFSSGLLQYQIPYPYFVLVPHPGMNLEHPVTALLEQLLFPWTSTITFGEKAGWKYVPWVQSSEASFLVDEGTPVTPDVLENLQIKPGKKHILAGHVEMPSSAGKPARLVIIANFHFAKNNFLADYQGNLLFLQNILDWVSWGEQLIGIRSRGKTDSPLSVPSAGTIQAVRWIHVLGIPLAVVGTGFLIHLLRKRRQTQRRNLLLGIDS